MISTSKRFPSLSLLLLLIAYASIGRFLAMISLPRFVWVIAVSWVILVALFFISPLSNIRSILYRWLRTDTIAFLVMMIAAALLSALVLWWHFFLYIFVIITAESLARLDMRIAEFGSVQTFLTLVTVSLIGLVSGWFTIYLVG